MPNLLDLPDNCLEIIATQFSSRYFSFQDLSYVLSTFDNRNYCEYILGGKFCSKEHEYFDNIYINLFDNEVTDEDRTKYRIVGPELILPHQTSYSELQKLSLVPLLRVWSGDPTLTIILALHPYVIRHRGHGRMLIYKDDGPDRKAELREEIVRKVWGRQQLLLEDYQYFKQREIENITELSIEIDDVVKKGFEGFRYLHPVVLTVTIKSDRWAYPGEIIPQLLDLANVEVFKLAYNKTHAVVTGWDVIVPELEEVKELDITVGSIGSIDDFFNYRIRSIEKFKLSLLGGGRAGHIHSTSDIYKRMKRVMRPEHFEVTIKPEQEIYH